MSENTNTLEADQYLSFGSLSLNLPSTLRERKVSSYEARLQAFIGDGDQAGTRLIAYRDTHEQVQTQRAETQQATDTLIEGAESRAADFWTRLDASGLSLMQRLSAGRSQCLLAEAQLQVYEGRLSEAAYQQIKEVVSEPWSSLRGQSTTRVCDLSLGTSQRSYLLLGTIVITRQKALDDHQAPEPVYLFAPGKAGGLHAFTSVAQLKTQLARSVRVDPDGFWLGHVSLKSRAAARAAIMVEGTESPVILRVLDGHAFNLVVEDQIASYQEMAELMARGQFLHSESTIAQSLERLCLDTAENLQTPDNQAREQGIDLVAEQLRTAQATQDLPDWLLLASVEDRANYAKALAVYARNAVWLEEELSRNLPSFEVFTRDVLAERLKTDLKRDIDPDAVRVDMPDQVNVEVLQAGERPERPHLAGDTLESIAITGFSTWDDVSLARHTFSLSELARKNIDVGDEQQMLRLKHSYFTLDGVDTQALGIDLKYLLKTIPDLDVAMLYSLRITSAFLGRTVEGSQPGAPDITRRLEVFRQAINLEAWVARQRGHLSERGHRLAQAATAPGSYKPGAEFDIEYRYTGLRSPDRGDGSNTEQALIGVSVVHDKTTGLALMYLPGAPGNQNFFEDTGFQRLVERLSNHVLLDRELLAYFSNSGTAGSDVARNTQNINAILRIGTYGFLVIDPVKAPHMSLTDMQYLARMGRLKEQVYGSSRSALDIERRQMERIAARDLGYIKIGLSVIPGIGTTIGVYDGWHNASASISAFARGDYKAGAWLALSAALNLGEAILALAPLVVRPGAVVGVTKATANLYEAGLRASKSLQKKRLRDLLPSVSSAKPGRTKAFEGYAVHVRLQDAVRLTGKN